MVLVLAVLALVPARYGRWTDGLGDAATLIIAPVTQPVRQTTAWLLGDPGSHDPTAVQLLQQERDIFRTLWLQERERGQHLEHLVTDLQRGALANELPVRQLSRRVIGTSSDGSGDHLTVRAGMREGVEVNVVATTAGVQLAGRVVTVDSLFSSVQLITSKAAGWIAGVVMGEGDVRGAKVLLSPIGESRLQGYVEHGAEDVQVGQLVRLDDEKWPRSARMLVLGQVTEVDKGIDGRLRVIVKPTVELGRLSEVVLRLTLPEDYERLAGEPLPSKRSTDGNP
jgi:hypothetical protein